MTSQLRVAEHGAGAKSSRLLRKLLKLFSDTKDLSKPDIVDLVKLYRCVHKDEAKVVWISGDEDAQQRAEELGFLAPDLRAPDSDISDVEANGVEGSDCSTPVVHAATETTDNEGNAQKEQIAPLKVEVQDLKRRLSSLDVGVVDLDTAVSNSAEKNGIMAQPHVSNACIIL
jgi:hypothetical protein